MPIAESPPGPIMRIDGREYLYFVGTGYLGLQAHPEVIRAACEAAAAVRTPQRDEPGGIRQHAPLPCSSSVAPPSSSAAKSSFYFSAGYASNSILLRAVEERLRRDLRRRAFALQRVRGGGAERSPDVPLSPSRRRPIWPTICGNICSPADDRW